MNHDNLIEIPGRGKVTPFCIPRGEYTDAFIVVRKPTRRALELFMRDQLFLRGDYIVEQMKLAPEDIPCNAVMRVSLKFYIPFNCDLSIEEAYEITTMFYKMAGKLLPIGFSCVYKTLHDDQYIEWIETYGAVHGGKYL